MTFANRVTLLRVALIPLYLGLAAVRTPGFDVAAAVLFALLALSDTLDGYLARTRGEVTTFGKFMDPMADKLLVLLSLTLLCAQGRVGVWPVLLILTRELVVSGFRLVAAEKGRVISAGILGKLKTVLQMVAVILLTLSVPVLQTAVLWASVAVTLWSGADYLWQGKDVLKEEGGV